MIPRRIFTLAAALFVAGSLLAPPAPAAAAGADDFVRATGARAFNSLGADIGKAERANRFRDILTQSFDLPTIARFVLGRYWRIANKKQRGEYIKLFEDFIVQAYAHRFKDLSGKEFLVKQTRNLTARDKLVLSEVVIGPGRPPLRVNWRVRGYNDRHRIVDVMVEGISMSVTQRDEFAAVIRRSGGKVEGLLVALRKKTDN
jgi:phospholipid transport system substrate-binding protein